MLSLHFAFNLYSHSFYFLILLFDHKRMRLCLSVLSESFNALGLISFDAIFVLMLYHYDPPVENSFRPHTICEYSSIEDKENIPEKQIEQKLY